MSEASTDFKLDLESLILKGIADAKGSEKALEFLTEEDLTNLGKMLADREAGIKDLFSVVVDPINNIATAIEKGNYSDVYSWINEKHVPLGEVSGKKRIFLVPVTENVDTGKEEEYVKKFGLTLCKNAPNYLAGMMAVLPEDKIPASLKGKDFVAAENVTASVFEGEDGDRCFLSVDRDDGKRKLRMVRLSGRWDAPGAWVFLAEKPE